ncbi:MAG: DNA cytosine methyltransferase [Planctomycetota bacterium]
MGSRVPRNHDLALRALSLCAGIGGLDLALRRFGVRTVAYVEREAYAAAVLVQAMEEGRLDAAPVWSGLESFDTRAWRGAVDLVTAGFPCQPVSCAGKRLGVEDERWLWPDVLRIVDELQPAVVFLENTPGILVRGGIEVAGSLAGRGYRVAWDCLSAAQLGAPHLRFRWFCLAAHPELSSVWTEQGWCESGRPGEAESGVDGSQGTPPDPDRAGCFERWRTESGPAEHEAVEPLGRGGAPADPDGRPREGCGLAEPAGQPSESGREPDGSASTRGVRGTQAWRGDQGIPEPVLCGVDARLPARAHRLHVLGNSVIPAQAAFAWRKLWTKMRR